MNKLLLIATIAVYILTIGCSKDMDISSMYDSEAIIVGYDFSHSDCNRGYIINIQNDKNYPAPMYTDSLPTNELSVTTSYPVKVYLSWNIDTSSTCTSRIIVEKIERAE